MFLCKNAIRVLVLSLLSAQVTFLNAMPGEQNQTNVPSSGADLMALQQTAGSIPPPPGPYSSSAVSTQETPISVPVQMPASVPVDGQTAQSGKAVPQIPMGAFSPDIPWPDDEAASRRQQSEQQSGMSKTLVDNQVDHQKQPATQVPSGAGARASDYRNNSNPQMIWQRPVRQKSQWVSAPPAPPGPYGFVPNYMQRPVVNSNNRFGYNNPYNPAHNRPVYNNPAYNNYGMQYGRPMPGTVYSPPAVSPSSVNPSMRNPAYSNPGYFYGYPNQGGFNQGTNPTNLDQNNLHQSDLNQGGEKQ
jgi:hypothetical protein